MKNDKSENQLLVREVFSRFLESKSLRKTPERFAILSEIYDLDEHFDIEFLFIKMKKKKYRVSRATLYTTLLNFCLNVIWSENISLEVILLIMKNLILIDNMII